jgi:predicted ATPase with chaperone activity
VETIDKDCEEEIAKVNKATKMFIIVKAAIAEITKQLHRHTLDLRMIIMIRRRSMVTRYQKRILGPLLDWIDIHMRLSRVEAARLHQRTRFAGTDIASNADMRPAQLLKYCALDEPCQNLMETAMRQLQHTARASHRVLKLSRTIADLAGSEAITQVHLAEALQYRPKLELM